MDIDERMNPMARRIFAAALLEDRCGELLNTLFDGGSATIGDDGKLVVIRASVLKTME